MRSEFIKIVVSLSVRISYLMSISKKLFLKKLIEKECEISFTLNNKKRNISINEENYSVRDALLENVESLKLLNKISNICYITNFK